MSQQTNTSFSLQPVDNARLAQLCGQLNSHLKQIEEQLEVSITSRGQLFSIDGVAEQVRHAKDVIQRLYAQTAHDDGLTPERVFMAIGDVPSYQQGSAVTKNTENLDSDYARTSILRTPKLKIKGQNESQRTYIRQVLSKDLTFGIGPAGTGKTYLAVACAVEALSSDLVKRIILVRPAVEAGERLGFLPGDVGQKVDPYLRPLYDALYDMLGVDKVAKMIERHVIELAPLAYMRGRTLNDAYVILDEAQNTTKEQMKMFLTRIGFGSKAVITGDITQIDLPKHVVSGLRHACDVLDGINDIGFVYFKHGDVVRHPLVQKIVKAYDEHGRQHATQQFDREANDPFNDRFNDPVGHQDQDGQQPSVADTADDNKTPVDNH